MMLKKTVLLSALLLPLFISTPLRGDVLIHTFEFDQEKITRGKYLAYDQLFYPGCDLSAEPGCPQLPIYLGRLLLPGGAEVTSLRVLDIDSLRLSGAYHLWPAQKPRILSDSGPFTLIEPDPEIYSASDLYPASPVRFLDTGSTGAGSLAEIEIYPFQYRGSDRDVFFNERITVEISYEPGAPGTYRTARSGRNDYAAGMLKHFTGALADNGQALNRMAASASDPGGRASDAAYILITDETLVSTFQPLVAWKTQKGVPAVIVTTQHIYQSYDGYDDPEKIRNYIKEAYQNRGALWIALGGDTNYIPCRKCFVLDSGYGANDIPVDLYFSDLDGTWDLDGDHEYGEIEDDVDLYPEVFVGRMSVQSQEEAAAYVSKLLTYEKNPPVDYQNGMIFIGGVLWQNPFTDASISKEMIDARYVPDRFDPITKLYQTQGNMTIPNFVEALNEGATIINHDDHGSYNGFGIGGWFDNADADALTNGDRLGILFTISCQSGGFDKNCLGEHFIENPDGGLIAFIGNSRYGWGSPGNPGYGYSDRYDHKFFEVLFPDDIPHIGATLGIAKAYYASRSRWANVYRWCQFQTNLLGDPEMPIWTDIPDTLEISYPAQIPVGESRCPVVVRCQGAPVAGARICLQKGADVYESALTGDDGLAAFSIAPQSPGPLTITVTAHNCLPAERTLQVAESTGPYPAPISSAIDDASGNRDGILNAGESVDLLVTVQNFGGATASSVEGTLACSDAMVTLTGPGAQMGSIPPGATAAGRFSFTLDESCADSHVIYFDLTLEDETKQTWLYTLPVTSGGVLLYLDHFEYTDEDSGNGNGMIDPGETVEVYFTVGNSGRGIAYDTAGEVSESDPFATVTGGTFSLGDIPPGGVGTGSVFMTVDGSCPQPHIIPLNITLASGSDLRAEDIQLVVGQTGFYDDVEAGTYGWTHTGQEDLWHIVSNRSHSASHSWYCGDGEGGGYRKNMDCTLRSKALILPNDPVLSFWTWYDLDLYGSDGIYVEIEKDGDVVQLDFIGSGGALGGGDERYTESGWIKESYDLSGCGPGDEVYIRFRFYSDNNARSEGLYIDNVAVNNTHGEMITVLLAGAGEGPQVPQRIRGFNNQGGTLPDTDFSITPAGGYGARVDAGAVRGMNAREILASHGPGPDLPPLVKGFDIYGQPVGAIQFLAYGINRYGTNIGTGDLNGDGSHEILTGPGPGPVFGPHVRAWDYRDNAVSPMAGVNFKAYGTGKWGVYVRGADIDGDGYDEILTGAGSGKTFGPHVRAFNFDDQAVTPIEGVNFFAYGTRRWGAKVAGGDLDRDGYGEILTAPGPGTVFGPNIRGWNYDNGTLAGGRARPMSDVNFMAYHPSIKFGAEIQALDVDGDGYDEMITGPGPGAAYASHLRGWNYDAVGVTPYPGLSVFAFGYEIKFGLHVAGGLFRY
jgi:hypothetical protein